MMQPKMTLKLSKHAKALRETLKGAVEHRLFLMWVLADSHDEADRLLQRLIDVRFERKKCEAQALANQV